MASRNPYVVSPELMQELDQMLGRFEHKLLNSDITPTNVDWFRYRGFKECVTLVKNLAFTGADAATEIEKADAFVVRHTDLVDHPHTGMEDME